MESGCVHGWHCLTGIECAGLLVVRGFDMVGDVAWKCACVNYANKMIKGKEKR